MVNAWRHESFFTYNVTRPYPFRWFTPAVFVLIVFGLAIFTIINLVTQGLQIITVSTANPALLVKGWQTSLPTFLQARTRPTCSPVQISIGTQISSSKKGLSYKLAAVVQQVDNSPWSTQSALQYTNDPIQNCTVTALSISLDGKSRSPQERAWMEWGPRGRAFIQCDIPVARNPIFQSTTSGPDQTVRLNLTTIYDYVSDDIAYGPGRVSNGGLIKNPSNNGLSSLVVETNEQGPSLFWAASLLSMYWAQTSARMTNATEKLVTQQGNNNANSQLGSGIVYFQRNKNVNDIKDLGFFDVDFRMFFDQANGDMNISFANASDTISSLASTNATPNIWIPADSLAKSLWSTIMSDLGDQSQTQVIVNDPDLTEYFSSNFTSIIGELNHTRFASARPGPSQQPLQASSVASGSFNATRSTIDTQYLCQLPVWKNPAEIFILVLAQNIVFLSSLWAGWKLLVGLLFLSQTRLGRDINYCEGHIDNHRAKSMEMSSGPQAPEVSRLMSRRWQRQEDGIYDNGTGSGSGYAPVLTGAPSPPPPVSRFSKDFKTLPTTQVVETRRE